jgi:CTP synthase
MFCNVKPDCVIENRTLPILYEAPLMLEKAHFSEVVCRELGIQVPEADLHEWTQMVERIENRDKNVEIGLVGKYVGLHDAYLSVAEALRHAGYQYGANINIHWIDAEEIEKCHANMTQVPLYNGNESNDIAKGNGSNAVAGKEKEVQGIDEILGKLDGIIVPGGFGNRGIEGMILAAKYAREHEIPYFGICLGMQIAVIEYARDVAGITDANSGEFDEQCKNKVIDFMPGQSDSIDKGGTLRLGAYPCDIKPQTVMERCYFDKNDNIVTKEIDQKETARVELAKEQEGTARISERHRHRYEFNNDYREVLQQNGLTLCGMSPDGQLVEAVELSDRPFYVGVQFHPEFKSRPNKAHPLFKGFIHAALDFHEKA